MNIRPADLKKILPHCRDIAVWSRHLAGATEIDTKPRTCAFIAQVGHESLHLTKLLENLSYSARRLTEVWPKRFPTLQAAMPYARNPEKLANLVYGNRLGNGPPESGDGWRYRGRGLMQVTGRANYAMIGDLIRQPLIDKPQMLEIPTHAVRAAVAYWMAKDLNTLADQDTEESFREITRRINGGYNGWDDRLAIWQMAKAVL